MEQWANYFIATASAAAALTGLIFVSVSLNLKQILAGRQLPGRALGSLILLGNILISSSFCLIPHQSLFLLGCELLGMSVTVWFVNFRMDIAMYRMVEKLYKRLYLQNTIFTQLAVLPYIVGGIFLLNGSDIGFYFIIPGITFSFIKALLDSWVLLIEINR